MKNTIIEDMRVEVVQEEILNDNLLLQIRRENQATPYNVIAVLRYIEDNMIKEDVIARLDPSKSVEIKDNIIAILDWSEKVEGPCAKIHSLFDIETHDFVEDKLKDTIYHNKFDHNPFIKYKERKSHS